VRQAEVAMVPLGGPILAVDDELRYTWAIQSILEVAGYDVVVANDGASALATFATEDPVLVLLDVRMPDMTGLEVCRRIREFSTVPVIFLTALAEEADKVKGLDAGADDYITKPFGAQELLARVRAALRRTTISEIPSDNGVVRVGCLEVNLVSQRVTVAGAEVGLTATEFKVLAILAERPDHIRTTEDLLSYVWGSDALDHGHLLRQVIYRLRHKLETDPSAPQLILNRPGVGYYLAGADSRPAAEDDLNR